MPDHSLYDDPHERAKVGHPDGVSPHTVCRRLAVLVLILAMAMLAPVLFAMGQSGQQGAGPLTDPLGTYRAQMWRIPVADKAGGTVPLDATLFRPAGDGPFPLAIISHGAALSAPTDGPWDYRPDAAIGWFIAHGYVVAVPIRQGYGRSGGERGGGINSCSEPDYVHAGNEIADDILGVLTYLRDQPFVVPDRTILVGHSAGATGSLAAASRNPEGLAGVIAFAPGGGRIAPHKVCREDLLVEAFRGAANQLPTLWVYAVNDTYFGPRLARLLFDAYVSDNASRHEFVMLPPNGEDGHSLFLETDAPALWGPAVDAFLKRILP